jgi:hypothetical protein
MAALAQPLPEVLPDRYRDLLLEIFDVEHSPELAQRLMLETAKHYASQVGEINRRLARASNDPAPDRFSR